MSLFLKTYIIFSVFLIFALGVVAGAIISHDLNLFSQTPISSINTMECNAASTTLFDTVQNQPTTQAPDTNTNTIESTTDTIINTFRSNRPQELSSPYDHIKENQIHVYDSRIIIDIDDPEWATFTDTNYMDPVIDYGANAIEIIPKTQNEVHVGDIVSYRSDYAEGIIIHRVIGTGYDSVGWYAVMKGDNNPEKDPGKVRFEQIQRIVVAIIY